MCSYIIQTLQQMPATTICYYFCNSQDGSDVYHQVLKTIVLQIIRQHPEEVSSLIAHQWSSQACGMMQLKSLVPQLLQMFTCSMIIVDGIDECSQASLKIIKGLKTICSETNSCRKVLFSSRNEPGIASLLRRHQVCLDDRAEVNSDIQAFVKCKVSRLLATNPQVLERVEAILLEKANGNFLAV